METTVQLIHRMLGINLTDPAVRRRAWSRQTVYREIARECEADGNFAMAETLRRIIQQATHAKPDLVSLALLAGLEEDENDEDENDD